MAGDNTIYITKDYIFLEHDFNDIDYTAHRVMLIKGNLGGDMA